MRGEAPVLNITPDRDADGTAGGTAGRLQGWKPLMIWCKYCGRGPWADAVDEVCPYCQRRDWMTEEKPASPPGPPSFANGAQDEGEKDTADGAVSLTLDEIEWLNEARCRELIQRMGGELALGRDVDGQVWGLCSARKVSLCEHRIVWRMQGGSRLSGLRECIRLMGMFRGLIDGGRLESPAGGEVGQADDRAGRAG